MEDQVGCRDNQYRWDDGSVADGPAYMATEGTAVHELCRLYRLGLVGARLRERWIVAMDRCGVTVSPRDDMDESSLHADGELQIWGWRFEIGRAKNR